jgi:UDP-glucose 4-epimerase
VKVLITGGAGYLGTELVDRLSRRDDVSEIVVYDNLSRPNYNLFIIQGPAPLGKVRFVRGDVLDSRKLRAVLRGVDVIYHLAARVTTPYSDESAHLYEQVNHWGTAELVTAVEESEASRFIFTSSAAVYGFAEDAVNAETLPHPKTYYGAAKLRGEQQVARLRDKISTFVVRCANVYGYSRSLRFDAVINRFVFCSRFGEPMVVQGSGRQVRSFVNILNAAACLERLLDTTIPTGTYNLLDRTLSILSLIDTVRAISPEAEVLFVNQHVEPRHLNMAFANSLGDLMRIVPGNFEAELERFSAQFATKKSAGW